MVLANLREPLSTAGNLPDLLSVMYLLELLTKLPAFRQSGAKSHIETRYAHLKRPFHYKFKLNDCIFDSIK